MAKTAPIIETIDIHKNFKTQKVLKGVSFSMQPGEIYGVVGLNGIGKTTIIKIILGLMSQDQGAVKLFGKNNRDMEAKKNITYLPEKLTPSAFLKGEEFLSITCGYYGQKYNKKEAEKICTELGFNPAALSEKVSKYSKGMGQKLGLASIFMSKSPLLILDEPMSGLDPSARILLKKKLKEYRQQGNSVFFTSHILSDIEEICDTIAILHDGNLHYEGTVSKFVKTYNTANLEQAFLRAIEMKVF